MRKLIYLLLLLPIGSRAQSWVSGGTTQAIITGNKQIRWNFGANGFVYGYTKGQVDSLKGTIVSGVSSVFGRTGAVMALSADYSGFYPLLNGTGATGTWGVGITGNAGTVTNGVYTTTFNGLGDARYPQLSSSYANPSWITSLAWSKITSTPTTLSGYGITDAQPLNTKLTAIGALANASGVLTNNGSGVFSYSAIPTGTDYIQNGTSQQTSANFNIDGFGKAASIYATGTGGNGFLDLAAQVPTAPTYSTNTHQLLFADTTSGSVAPYYRTNIGGNSNNNRSLTVENKSSGTHATSDIFVKSDVARLDLNATSSNFGDFNTTLIKPSQAIVVSNGATNGLLIGSESPGDVRFIAGGNVAANEFMSAISSTGFVGIRYSTPDLTFAIQGVNGAPATSGSTQTNGTLRLKTTGNNSVLDFGHYASGAGAWMQSTDKTDLSLKYGLFVQPNGGGMVVGTSSALISGSTVNISHTGDQLAALIVGDRATPANKTGVFMRTNSEGWLAVNSGKMIFSIDGTSTAHGVMTNAGLSLFNGNITPTAYLDLKGGTTALAALRIRTAGVVLTTPVSGAIENDGTNLFYTDNTPTRQTIATGFTFRGAGQTTLVAGTKAVSITGVTTGSQAFVQAVSQGGTVTTTFEYAVVCTAGTITITALTNGNVTNTLDTSVLNYYVIN